MKSTFVLAIAAVAALVGSSAVADPVSVEVLLTPQEQMKFEFADGSKHFVLAVRREGKAEGSGAFAGAAVSEIGWHDVNPPVSGDPRGYLQLTAENGDVAILRWMVKATFVKGAEGKPALFNNGVWELVSGTGQFAEKRGVGSLIITPRGGPNLFTLAGEVGDKP
jgi:hypothetical protein